MWGRRKKGRGALNLRIASFAGNSELQSFVRIGFGMIYLPSVVAVGYYFETKRSLATGIAVCGSGVGTFGFSPLATLLLEEFGSWRSANLLLAGLILNCAVFGALMRPLVYPKFSGEKPLLQRMADEKRLQMERGSIGGSYFMVQMPDGKMERRLKTPLNIDPGVHSSLNLEALARVPTVPSMAVVPTVPTLPTITEVKVVDEKNGNQGNQNNENGKLAAPTQNTEHKMSRNVSSPAFSAQAPGLPKNGSVPFFDRQRKQSTGERFKPSLAAIKATSKTSMNSQARNAHEADGEAAMFHSRISVSSGMRDRPRMVRPMSRKDIFYSGSVLNLPQYQSQKSLQGYRNSVLSLPASRQQTEADREQYDLCPCLTLPQSFKQALSSTLDVSLLKDPTFLMIGISNIFGMAGLYVPFVYIVDAAVQNHIEKSQASFLLSIIGITNTFGRIICGWVADFPWMDSLLLNNVCLILATVSVAVTPFCYSYGAYVTIAILFGIAISGYISLTSIILVDLLGLDKLTNAFGLLMLFRGAATIVGSPLAGAVYDATRTYNASFYMAATFFLISTITSFCAPLFRKKQEEVPIGTALEPIDEDLEEGEEEDPEDTPITMGSHIATRPPAITHTVASPSEPSSPPNQNDQLQRESVL
ncbi:Monocarboxylate transporter 5 [Eumeta japonica]|uniref:Monocarboxylate transporter 5 n=1 Tax=Eumeta variegata TaxID=151549 RepID=A0A4C1U4J2_EUMVA|nr:Monocarboxylate transporter 5 [Eumeta japonica]